MSSPAFASGASTRRISDTNAETVAPPSRSSLRPTRSMAWIPFVPS